MSYDHSYPCTMAERFRSFLPVVIDVETAGFNSQTDALLQISAVILQMDSQGYIAPYEQYTINVEPFDNANLEASALEFIGIDPFDPGRDAVSEAEALKFIFTPVRQAVRDQGCSKAILVGHNAFFDLGFVNAAAQRSRYKKLPLHPFSSFDTATLAGLALGQTVLAKACLAADIPFDYRQAHDASYDTQKTAELFCLIVNRWKDLGGWDMVQNKFF